jgi:hypothetical protein
MQTSVFITPNSLLIECIINPSNGTTIQKNPFGTQQQLQNRKIIAIECVSSQDTAYSPISTGNPNIPPSVFTNAFLTLYTTSVFTPATPPQKSVLARPEGLWYDQIPLPILRRVHNYDTTANNLTSGGSDVFRIRPTEIAWTKSYVSIPRAIGIGQPYSALFIVHYLDEGDPGTQYN